MMKATPQPQGVGTEGHQCQHYKEEGDDAVQPQPPLLFLEFVLLLKLTLPLVLQDTGHEEEAAVSSSPATCIS